MLDRQHFGAGRQPKIRFKTKEAAYQQKQRNLDWQQQPLVAYECTCGGWHLGHRAAPQPNQGGEDE